MKKLVCFSIIYLSLISYTKKVDGPFVNPVIAVDTIHKSYLALGDSYTIGESVADTEAFPVQTVKFLRKHGISISNPDVIARTGWTTADLLNALNNHPPKKTFSVVSLLIGVNNQYRGESLDEYIIEFTKLMNMAVYYAGNIRSHVFILSIPDYSVTPFARGPAAATIAGDIDNFNAANRIISLNADVHYLDITSVSRNAKDDPALTAIDGLHPSAIQYKKWSELLAPVMLLEFH